MPLYNYKCAICGQEETRVAGLDDHMAVCVSCGGVMLRTDENLWGPYFKIQDAGSPFLQRLP